MFFNAKNLKLSYKKATKKSIKYLIRECRKRIKYAARQGEQKWDIYGFNGYSKEVINAVYEYFVKRNFIVTMNINNGLGFMTFNW